MSLVEAAAQQSLIFSACSSNALTIPNLPGLNIHQLKASIVQNHSISTPRGLYVGHGAKEVTNLSFCNVSLAYTHTNHTEPINVQVWLPSTDSWNGRMMGIGGAGFSAGLLDLAFLNMAAAVDEGYVTISTDAGHEAGQNGEKSFPENWAMDESGVVNMYLFETFMHTAYKDQADLGKAVTESFYGSAPRKSYWNGCSTGGRQGLMLAQRYPEAYDGILANAPAINWAHLSTFLHWPQQVMHQLKIYPRGCELAALTAAATEECDPDDGVRDGVVSDPAACKFNPHDLVGKEVGCEGKFVNLSSAAAQVAEAAWLGPQTHDGNKLWHGISPDAELAGPSHLASTACADDICHANGFTLGWLQYFVAKDRSFDVTKLSHEDYERLFNQSVQEYDSLAGTNNPDLSAFRNAGGKMITVHGLADQLIPPGSTREYYDKVLKLDSEARCFYKYFEAPGLAHCFGGPGPSPDNVFEDLVAWVEEGRIPETLAATSNPNDKGEVFERPLCQYPLVSRYDGTGDVTSSKNYHCAEEHLSTTPFRTTIERTKKFLKDKIKTTTSGL